MSHVLSATPRRALLAAGLTLLLITAGCSSGDGSDGADAPANTTTTAGAAGGARCDDGPSIEKLKAVPVAGEAQKWTVTSFDGTEIRANWFPVEGATEAKPAPTVLMGPGWSEPGDTSTEGSALFKALSIPGLHGEGYNVLTWDPRGFGASTGDVTINVSTNEGRDVQALLDFVAQQPEAQLDGPADPRSGMVGFSYGGGIQFSTAAIDCRVDAIVPGIAWHSLGTSLYKSDTVKSGWSNLLMAAASGASLDPHITSASEAGNAGGVLTDEDEQWFLDRGPGDLIEKVTVPTLILQGTVDTLFTLDEALTNLRLLQDNQIPVSMLWFCGGHGACLTDADPEGYVEDAEFAWLARYVKGDESVDTGPAFRTVDQNGKVWTADRYPTEIDGTISASIDRGGLALRAGGGAGPITSGVSPGDVLGSAVMGITPARARQAVDLAVNVSEAGMVLGAPRLTLTYSGTGPSGDLPTRLFAQLVDETRDVVIGNQITPVPITLDGKTHTVTIDLEAIAQSVEAGDTITLQLTPTTVAYREPQLGGSVTFTKIQIELPLVTSLQG